MARLNKTHKRFIVERLACFSEPSEVVEAVKEEFDLEISRQQVWTYDPTKPANSVAEDLEELFEETREGFVSATEGIAISHKSYRLEQLHKMFRQANRMRNYGLAAQLLEQAAKEVGDLFTNRRELTGKNGGPIEQRVSDADLEARRKLRERDERIAELKRDLSTRGVAGPAAPEGGG